MTETAFSELNLTPEVEKAVAEMGFTVATPVQAQAIPLIRTGVDVIARSQTGTGKTVAFGIPSMEAIDTTESKATVQVLILCPTRELAQQAGEQIRKLARYTPGVRPVEVFGGADMERQIIRLRRANMVIGTPGRVMDHLRRKTLKLDNLKMIVLDEADEMLKMGFKEDIETILTDTPEDRQTVLFSATMPPPILALTKQFQNDPQMVEINKSQVTIDNIKQTFVEVPLVRKNDAMGLLLHYHQPRRTLVFCNTKRMVDELAEYLRTHGHAAESIHGDLKQSQRTSVMNAFKGGKVSILVATDVAARGIDVSDVDYVFNYDIPMKTEEYVHRIGRTGRAGKSGAAITLCCGRRQVGIVRNLARVVKSDIKQETLPTVADLGKCIEARNLATMRTALSEELSAQHIAMVETLVEEGFSAEQIAAAALMIQFPTENLEKFTMPIMPAQKAAMGLGGKKERGERGERSDRSDRSDRGNRNAGFADIVINVGYSNRVTPGHLVGAISEYSGLSGKQIGKIDISEDQCVVGVPADEIDNILEAMKGRRICGKPIHTERLAGGYTERRDRNFKKPYGSKSAHFAKDRVAKWSNNRDGGNARRRPKRETD